MVCRKRFEQDDLLRFVLIDGRPVFDFKRKFFGRGRYVCPDCIALLEKKIKKFCAVER